jgi:hypothetical protein
MSYEITEEQVQAIADVLGRVSREVNGSDSVMVTRFFAIVETMDSNGDVGLEAFFTAGLSVWDQLGMLAFQQRVSLMKIELPSG